MKLSNYFIPTIKETPSEAYSCGSVPSEAARSFAKRFV